MALPGIGALQESLQETNRLLEAVLVELQRTNGDELAGIRTELRRLNHHLGAGAGD